jgi:hypothetical protein
MATTVNYFVAADPSWELLQFQKVSLTYDTTLADANVYLPELSTIDGKLVEIQITNIGGGVLTVYPFADVSAVPPVQDTISGATSFQFPATAVFFTLKINQIDSVAIDWAIEQSLTTSVPALAQAGLAAPPYTNYPVGIVAYVLNYDATAKGCAIQKTADSNSNYLDWTVIATESTTDTGGFGQNPA